MSLNAASKAFFGPSQNFYDVGEVVYTLYEKQQAFLKKSIICQLAEDNLLVFQICYHEQSPLWGNSGHPLIRIHMSGVLF